MGHVYIHRQIISFHQFCERAHLDVVTISDRYYKYSLKTKLQLKFDGFEDPPPIALISKISVKVQVIFFINDN